MKPFRFRWQRILEFRATKLAEEERKLGVLQEELTRLDREKEQIELARQAAAASLAAAASTNGDELRTLTRYQAKLRRHTSLLDEERSVCERRLAGQQESYLEARREHRLIEKLREKRRTDWVQDSNRELGKLADELYLARWDR